jgi:Tn3 transposase DDE domain
VPFLVSVPLDRAWRAAHPRLRNYDIFDATPNGTVACAHSRCAGRPEAGHGGTGDDAGAPLVQCTGNPAADKLELLAAVLADGTNLGLALMADASRSLGYHHLVNAMAHRRRQPCRCPRRHRHRAPQASDRDDLGRWDNVVL